MSSARMSGMMQASTPSVTSLNVWKRALDELGYLARKRLSSGY